MSLRSGGDASIDSDYVMVSGSLPPSKYVQVAGFSNRIIGSKQDSKQQTSVSKMTNW
jgi:hypothetical protein